MNESLVHIEFTDVTEYTSQISKLAKEALGIYEQIAHQNVEKSLSLVEISLGLVEELSKAGIEMYAAEKVTEGLITIKLPLTSPLIRIQRGLTIASIMSNEPIPPQLALIDEVVAVAVTTLLNSQKALKILREANAEKVDNSLGGKSKVADALSKAH